MQLCQLEYMLVFEKNIKKMEFEVINLRKAAALNSNLNNFSFHESLARPRPQFFTDSATFSTKKEKGTPKTIDPPRPPIKSCPPVSRLKPTRRDGNDGARVISFVNNQSSDCVLYRNRDKNQSNDDSGELVFF